MPYNIEKENDIDNRLFNASNQTIQAGDPSLFLSSKRNLDAASLLSLNNDYDKLIEQNYSELKLKCLNDLNHSYEKKFSLNKENKDEAQQYQTSKKQNLTHVQVTVPSGIKKKQISFKDTYGSTSDLRGYSNAPSNLRRDFSTSGTNIFIV